MRSIKRPRVLVLCLMAAIAYVLPLSVAMAAPPNGLPPCRDDHPAHVDLSHIPPCQSGEDQPSPPAEEPLAEESPSQGSEESTSPAQPPTDQDDSALPPCGDDHPARPDLSTIPPCHDEPPAEEPPAEEPPVEESSAAEEPPAEELAAEEPPADQDNNALPPCGDDHPARPDLYEIPPCQDELPAEEPPAEESPAQESPTEEPPVEESPAQESPTEEPPVEESAAEEPPAEESPAAEEPPAEETPAEESPAQESPTEELSSDQPHEPIAVPDDGVSVEQSTQEHSIPSPPLPPSDLEPDVAASPAEESLLAEPSNKAPATSPIELTTWAGDDLTFDVFDFVTDPEGNTMTALAYSPPANGTLILEDGVATYSPTPGFFGSDQFTVRVCDSAAACTDALVSVTVPPINDFLLNTGSLFSPFISGLGSGSATYNVIDDLLTSSARRAIAPLAGLAGMVGASMMFGMESVGGRLRYLLAALMSKS
ncbi:MAG: Ig-like domain-containing protein [Acidimicrobiia bacterium]